MSVKKCDYVISVLFSILQIITASGHSGESTSGTKDSSRILALDDISLKQMDTMTPPASTLPYGGGSYYSSVRPGRQLLNSVNSFSPASLLSLASAASSGTNYGYLNDLMPEYGENAQASSGGWGPAPPAHMGGGFGFKDGYHVIKEDVVNYSAVGLLGFLALLSLIQNVLRQTSPTTVKPTGGGRKKRSRDTEDDESQLHANELNRVTTLILPLLTAVAHTRDGFVPSYCTYQEICNANAILTEQLGPQGRSLGSMLTDAVSNLLTKDIKHSYKHLEGKIIRTAGKAGRAGKNCKTLYKPCFQLNQLPTYSIPLSMLQNTEYKGERFELN